MAQKSCGQHLGVAASEIYKVRNSETFTNASSNSDASKDVVKRASRPPRPPYRQKEHARPINKRVLYLAAIAEHRNIKHLEELKRRAEDGRRSHRVSQRTPKEHLAQHDTYDRALLSRRTPRSHEPIGEAKEGKESRAVERQRPHKSEAGKLEGLTRDMMSSGLHHNDKLKKAPTRGNKDTGGLVGFLRNMISSRRLHLKDELEDDCKAQRQDRRHLRTYEAERDREARGIETRRPRRQHQDPEQERDSRKHRDQYRPSTRDRSRHDHRRRRLENEDGRPRYEEKEAQRVARRAARRAEEEKRLEEQEREVSRFARRRSSRESKSASFNAKNSTSTFTDERKYRIRDEGQHDEDANKSHEKDREAARELRDNEIQKLEEARRVAEQRAMVQAAERILAEEAAKEQAEEARRLQEEERLARRDTEEKEREAGLLKKGNTLAEEMEKQLAEERAKKRAEEREKVARRFKEERQKKLAEEKLRMAQERAKQRGEEKARMQAEEEERK
ncbi:hypothetical protein FLAG1_11521 [Fusarium langsethiae]|uniref:Uncharacterized protein n=1 Tax=Fusarium langsethiae TaxID=179993 RepID=A0A0M9EMH5_FUSLA|nr:hypothetical protein FLAG1_11521 [Fusarium langsethiae]GKU10401.1 unnamed protein product [Fusarium langsethiae]